MIAIVDYELGNLRSVEHAFEEIGAEAKITDDADEILDADAIVLPGVGAFGDGMANLREAGLVEPLARAVLEDETPYLGICLGLQLLADEGHEHGTHEGLGWIDGTVERIDPQDPEHRVPHIGWNDVHVTGDGPLYDGIDEPVFYFVHSFHLVPDDPACITGTCDHGTKVTASVSQGHVHAVQFHPEKSQRAGLKLLENFVGQV